MKDFLQILYQNCKLTSPCMFGVFNKNILTMRSNMSGLQRGSPAQSLDYQSGSWTNKPLSRVNISTIFHMFYGFMWMDEQRDLTREWWQPKRCNDSILSRSWEKWWEQKHAWSEGEEPVEHWHPEVLGEDGQIVTQTVTVRKTVENYSAKMNEAKRNPQDFKQKNSSVI